MAFVGTFFAAVGRLSVRFRWAIVLAWVAGAVAAMALLPSLSSVTQSDNTSFLPGQRAQRAGGPAGLAAAGGLADRGHGGGRAARTGR